LLQFTPDFTPIMRLTSEKKNLKLTIGISNEEDSFEAIVPVQMKGDGKIALNREHLLQPCKIFSEMKMEVTNHQEPCIITGDLEGVKILIMPMFVQW